MAFAGNRADFAHFRTERAAGAGHPSPARGDPEADAGLPRMTMRGAGKAFGGPAADRGTGGSKSGTATAQDSGGAESGAAGDDSRSTSLGLKRTVSRGAARIGEAFGQQLDGLRADLPGTLIDGGQRGGDHLGQGQVVKPKHRHVLGHRMPRRWRARMAPRAIMSLMQNIAVGGVSSCISFSARRLPMLNS